MRRCMLALLAIGLLSGGLITGDVEASQRHKVTIDSTPQGASVYLEDKAGGVQGKTPAVLNLPAGSYTIILELEDYKPLTRAIEVTGASSFSFAFNKTPVPARVTLDAPEGSVAHGATVKINGKALGQVPLSVSLQPGRYLVEVERDDQAKFSEWIDVQYGDRRTIAVAFPSPTQGALLIAANIAGAAVLVDGKKVDDSPALAEKLAPGKHTVEVRAAGYLSLKREVTVQAGKTTKVELTLEPDQQTIAKNSGTLQVLASDKGVEIFVDGSSRGKAPAKVTGLAEGSHVIEGRKDGFVPAEETIEIKTGELKTIKLTLKEAPPVRRTGSVRVVGTKLGAMVFIDGKYVGKTPVIRHELDPGPHFVSVRHPAHKELVTTVEVHAGKIAQVEAKLTPLPKEDDPALAQKGVQKPARPADAVRGISTYSAHLVPPSSFTADLSLGFPYIIEGQLTTGIFSGTLLGMDGGIDLRTFGAVSEIGGHLRLRLFRYDAFATGLLFALGGGGGPNSRNTFYTNFGAHGSFSFKDRVTFTTRAFFNVFTDRVCPTTPESDELSTCGTPPLSTGLNRKEVRERIGGVRFFLSAVLEVSLGRLINVWALFEGVPFQSGRHLYSDPFAELMPANDPGTYFRLGVTFKR